MNISSLFSCFFLPSPLLAAEEHWDENELTKIIHRVSHDDLLSTIFPAKIDKITVFTCCWPLAMMNLELHTD